MKLNLSHTSYRSACDQAFRARMSDPTVYWNADDGFYVAPSRDLAPNRDYCVGLAYYSLNNNSDRSLSGTRREYQPLAAGIRKYHTTSPDKRDGTLEDYVRFARSWAEYEDGLRRHWGWWGK